MGNGTKLTPLPVGFKVTKCPATDKQATPLRYLRKKEEQCIEQTGLTMVERARRIRENEKKMAELEALLAKMEA